jgi:hypothetical protein
VLMGISDQMHTRSTEVVAVAKRLLGHWPGHTSADAARTPAFVFAGGSSDSERRLPLRLCSHPDSIVSVVSRG